TTSGPGKVSDFTAQHLSLVAAGNGEHLAPRQQVLDWYSYKTLLNIERKHTVELEKFATIFTQILAKGVFTKGNIFVSSLDEAHCL
ncbi:glycerophosphodiester phosphodiesterase, partial [Pseudoalteromonas sp. S326]